jgi:uncharacterized membrane protein
MNVKALAGATLASVVALGLVTQLAQAESARKLGEKPTYTAEKCAGVAKAGLNDCQANGHSCATFAKKDNDANEWIYLPVGSCKQIGGTLVTKK